METAVERTEKNLICEVYLRELFCSVVYEMAFL
jgi:hypothetical protein